MEVQKNGDPIETGQFRDCMVGGYEINLGTNLFKRFNILCSTRVHSLLLLG